MGSADFSDFKNVETFLRARVSLNKQLLTSIRFIFWKFWSFEQKSFLKFREVSRNRALKRFAQFLCSLQQTGQVTFVKFWFFVLKFLQWFLLWSISFKNIFQFEISFVVLKSFSWMCANRPDFFKGRNFSGHFLYQN